MMFVHIQTTQSTKYSVNLTRFSHKIEHHAQLNRNLVYCCKRTLQIYLSFHFVSFHLFFFTAVNQFDAKEQIKLFP